MVNFGRGKERIGKDGGVNRGSRWMLESTGMNLLGNRVIYGITCK